MPRPACQAITHHGEQCSARGSVTIQSNITLCGTHFNVYSKQVERQNGVHHQQGTCFTIRNRRWCGEQATHGLLCLSCDIAKQTRREEERRNRIALELYNVVHRENNPHNWAVAALLILNGWADLDIRIREKAAFLYYKSRVGRITDIPPFNQDIIRNKTRFITVWHWMVGGMRTFLREMIPDMEIPNVIAHTELHRITQDGQNVHTSYVTKQTNEGEEKLLAAIIPEVQHTEKTLTKEWFSLPNAPSFNSYLKVANDVHIWFHKRTCRKENDELYHRLLRGLVATINRQEGERRTELFRRVWEECYEAVGLCCEGHISRLCNVLVGFDDTFTTPLSLNEQIQNEMGRISMLEVTNEEKVRQANMFFDHRMVPRGERQVWLDAF